jgi:hypothetical protein
MPHPGGAGSALGPVAGEDQEHVVHAGLAHGQGGRGELVVVEQAQRVDQQPGAVVGGQPEGGAVPLGLGGQALLADHLPERVAAVDVQAGGRLVQEATGGRWTSAAATSRRRRIPPE